MSKVEFSPPEPITEACGFCGTKIPEEEIVLIGITCGDCRRPVCPSCKTEIGEAGLTGCPYCKTVQLDENSVKVKQALTEIYNKKLSERKQKVAKTQSDETPWIMTTESQMPPAMANTSWSGSGSSSDQHDQYPYRDPPSPWSGPLAEPIDS
ncbi:hypothetical protein LCGC14_3145240, partial [marine sediment metagenome]